MTARPARTAALAAGIAVAAIAVSPPVDARADPALWTHMLQHMALTMVAAPLVVIGSPVSLLLRHAPAARRRRLAAHGGGRAARVLSAPLLAWTLLPAVQIAVYTPALLDRAAADEAVHAGVHVALFAAALLFWRPILGVDPMPRLEPLARVGYLLAAMPASDVVGVWLIASAGVHYPAHVTTGLGDQRRAGAVMLSGSVVLGAAALRAAWRWVERDHLRAVVREQAP